MRLRVGHRCQRRLLQALWVLCAQSPRQMLEPTRGMLRRPIGLLPSVSARAVNVPESMGHTAEAVAQPGGGLVSPQEEGE